MTDQKNYATLYQWAEIFMLWKYEIFVDSLFNYVNMKQTFPDGWSLKFFLGFRIMLQLTEKYVVYILCLFETVFQISV